MILTITELAEKLRTKNEAQATVVRRIRLWVKQTDIPCLQSRKGGKLRFFWPEVNAWLKRRNALPTPSATVYAFPAQSKPKEVSL